MIPRGIRLNNPMNIRLGDNWLGLTKTPQDNAFCSFIAPEYGIRAGMVILGNYAKRGLNTVPKIIGAWAPPSENDTASYIADVRKRVGKDTIQVPDYPALCKAIIWHENGEQPYNDSVFAEALRLAQRA